MGKSIFDALAFGPLTHQVEKIPVVGPYIVPAALSIAGQPELAAAYSGIRTGEKTGSPLSGLLAAGGTYAGNSLGSSLGQSLGESAGGLFSQTPANALGSELGGSTVGSIAPFGSFAGNVLGSSSIGSQLGGSIGSQIGGDIGTQMGGGPPGPSNDITPFSPSRSPQMGIPQSLSQFSSLDPFQQATNIATKGVYGGGNGPDENKYFLNLINRQLTTDQGGTNDKSSINPVENSYLSQLGLGGYGNSNALLQGISNYSY